MPYAAAPLRETYQDAGGVLACGHNLVLVSWHGAPSLVHARALREASRTALALSTSDLGLATLAFFEGGFPRFSEEVRREVVALAQETQGHSVCSAFVLLDPGFTTAIVRTFLAGAMLAARSPEPVRFFGRADQAVAWVVERCGARAPWSTHELQRTVDEFLARRRLATLQPARPR